MNFDEFIAGSLAGSAQVLSSHPLDTLKIKLQLNKSTALECAKNIVKQDGFLGFYKGLLPPLLGASIINAVLFSSYGLAKTFFSKQPTLYQTAVAGGFAGLVQSVVASPIELLKIRLQATAGGLEQRTLKDEFKAIYTKSGIPGLYRGMYMTVLREIPGYAGFYTGFEAVKRYQTDLNFKSGTGDLSLLQLMIAGSFGGISYWVACYPLDVLKSKIQSQPNLSSRLMVNVREIIKNDGLKGFTRGFTVSLLRSVPAAGATFTVYEMAIKFLGAT
jgi:solute carrier family 25 (mitochondrial carnitine/acylcarnitine transporter), member 20/29